RRDHRLLRVIFSVVFVADIGFFLNNNTIGIILFAIAQMLFISRHLKGVASLKRYHPAKTIQKMVLSAVSVISVNCILMVMVFIPRSDHPLFGLVAGYSFFLCASVFAGIASIFIGVFPRINAILIMIAVFVLYCGDVMVGLNLMLTSEKALIISTSLTWTFYLPAIVLFSLSGIRWKNDETKICFIKEIKKLRRGRMAESACSETM
ncbi:MAG: hypothetical protein OQK82_04585, partial [Candidatus Pacearchaeota archaeon]|nr:hypothetical protein [Candidatus Pacearchaeota archaeon]